MTVTRALLAGAVAATLADAAAFVLWIIPGIAVERNPLLVGGSYVLVLGAKAALLIMLIALASVIEKARAGLLRLVLIVAITVGLVGVVSTALSAVMA